MARPEKFRLGDLLVQKSCITMEQLEYVLSEQKRSGRKFGRLVVELGYTTDVTDALDGHEDLEAHRSFAGSSRRRRKMRDSRRAGEWRRYVAAWEITENRRRLRIARAGSFNYAKWLFDTNECLSIHARSHASRTDTTICSRR